MASATSRGDVMSVASATSRGDVTSMVSATSRGDETSVVSATSRGDVKSVASAISPSDVSSVVSGNSRGDVTSAASGTSRCDLTSVAGSSCTGYTATSGHGSNTVSLGWRAGAVRVLPPVVDDGSATFSGSSCSMDAGSRTLPAGRALSRASCPTNQTGGCGNSATGGEARLSFTSAPDFKARSQDGESSKAKRNRRKLGCWFPRKHRSDKHASKQSI